MKLTSLVRIFALSVFVAGSTLAIYAQDQHDDAKPAQDEARPEAAKPAHDANAPRPQEDAKPGKQQDEMKPHDQPAKPGQDDAHANPEPKAPQQNKANAAPAAHAKGGHIPDDKFRASFGRQHTVVINQPVVVEGQPRFQSGGYWFVIADPWPVGWAYTDTCYIDYIDGEYVLIDLLHPGVQIALTVVL